MGSRQSQALQKMHTRLYLRLPLTLHAPLTSFFLGNYSTHHENQENEKKAFLKALASNFTNTTIMFRFIDNEKKRKRYKRRGIAFFFVETFISCNLIPHVLVFLRHISQCYHDLLIFNIKIQHNNGNKCSYHERIIKGCHK